MSKRWLQTIICVTIIGLFFGWIRHVDAQAEQDTQLLLRAAKPFIQTNYQVTMKYTSFFGKCNGTDASVLTAGQQLSRELGVHDATDESLSSQGSIYTLQVEVEPGAVMTLTVASPEGQSACYAVLRLVASNEVSEEHLVKWQEHMTEQLQVQGLQGKWNVMIQGNAVSETTSVTSNPEAFLADIVHAYKGSVIESYVDGTTFSTSIAAPDFHQSVQSGKNKVNVQVALHQDTTTGLWRVTLGTSVITMEY